MIGRGDQLHWMEAIPGHAGGKVKDRLNRVKKVTIPMVLEYANSVGLDCTCCDRQIVGQTYGQAILVDKLDQALHELRPPTVVFSHIRLMTNAVMWRKRG